MLASLSGGAGSFSSNLSHTSSGTISSLLTSGSYLLKFHSGFEDLVSRSNTGIGATVGGSLDHFSFSIASIPEPSTWMMMILGFGLIGSVARRGKLRVTFA